MLTCTFRTGNLQLSKSITFPLFSGRETMRVITHAGRATFSEQFRGHVVQGTENLLGQQCSFDHIEFYGSIDKDTALENYGYVYDNYWKRYMPQAVFAETVAKFPFKRAKINGVYTIFYPLHEGRNSFSAPYYSSSAGYTWTQVEIDVETAGTADNPRFLLTYHYKYSTYNWDWRAPPVWNRTHTATGVSQGTNTATDLIDSEPSTWLSSLRTVLSKKSLFWDQLRYRVSRYPRYPEGGLVVDALKDLKSLDINTVTAVQGLMTLGRDIRELIAAAEGHVNPKWLVSTYLYMKYGFSNSVRDTVDLTRFYLRTAKNLMSSRPRWQVTHASNGVTFTPRDGGNRLSFSKGYEMTTLTPYVSTLDEGLAKVVRSMMDLDVFPELGNVWDIIPFSFVVDWFIPISELIDAVDANTYRALLKVGACLISQKYDIEDVDVTRLLPGMDQFVTSNVDVRYYKRVVQAYIPDPIPELRLPTSFTQWLPAGALIAQGAFNRH